MLLIMLHSGDCLLHVRVSVCTEEFLLAGIGESRLDITRHENGDLDTEGAHLIGEGLRKTVDGKLRSAIECLEWQAVLSHHAADA